MASSREAVRVPLTKPELRILAQILKIYKTQKATLLQIYMLKGLKDFEKVREKGFFRQMRDGEANDFVDAVVIRVEAADYQRIKDYAGRMEMTVPKFVRFLAIPKMQEEYSNEVMK